MQPPKAIALTNAFFSSGVLMEHTELFGRKKSSSPTPLTSFPRDLGSHTPRVKGRPGEPYRTGEMLCVARERQSLKPFHHHSQCAGLQTEYAPPPHRFAARISTREHVTSVTTCISCSGWQTTTNEQLLHLRMLAQSRRGCYNPCAGYRDHICEVRRD